MRVLSQLISSKWRSYDAQPEASQRLWSRCKPLGYCQGRLEVRLSQRQDRLPPLQARTSGLRLLVCTSCAHLLRAPTCSEELVTCMGC